MYDNIKLMSRIKRNGKLKKKNISILGKSITFILNLLLIFFILTAVGVYGFTNFNNIMLSTLIDSIMTNHLLQCNIIVIILLCLCKKINMKGNYSVAINVTDEDIIRIIFNEGKHIGLEYRIFIDDISNICIYKDNSFSFYCALIEVDKDNSISDTKGVIYLKGGDTGLFIEDLQRYSDKRVQYKNKKN